MKLFYLRDDYTVLKVRLVAAVTSTNVEFHPVATLAELQAQDSAATSLLLETSTGERLTRPLAIVRFVAEQSALNAQLLLEDVEKAQVEQWLEFSLEELEVPIQAVLANEGTVEAELIRTQAKQDVAANLAVLEDHLTDRTFVVSESLSLADLSLFAAYVAATVDLKLADKNAFRALSRWSRSVAAVKVIKDVLSSATVARVQTLPAAASSSAAAISGEKFNRHRIRVKELLAEGTAAVGKTVVVKGWIRTTRDAEKGAILFIELTDGSTVRGIQLVMNADTTQNIQAVKDCGGSGASLAIIGTVVASPTNAKQAIEVHVTEAQVLGVVLGGDNGTVGGKNYPMAKKQHTLEFLREKAHLRPRSKLFSSALRVRNAMAFATHKFFNERGFVYVHTPLITAADCEGAGEQFVVTTLLPEQAKPGAIPVDKKGEIDYSKDFFGRRCCLTVSGQLNVETHACALSDVYTFGPTFRAENSHTARHLAEFWMIEPEICFADLVDDMALAEDYVKFCTRYALEHCADDLHYFENEYPAGEKGLQARLRNVVENDFARITYTEAVKLLQEHVAAGKIQFLAYPQWGDDLGSEHERYITEKVYQKPTIVINYPKGIKAFYMKVNDDNETVAAMDVLVPKIGELIGGSQREEQLHVLEQRCRESGLKPDDIWWYNDLRRYGTVPHAGFGLGFERLIMFVTGLENIRDVIPFPRVPGHAEF